MNNTPARSEPNQRSPGIVPPARDASPYFLRAPKEKVESIEIKTQRDGEQGHGVPMGRDRMSLVSEGEYPRHDGVERHTRV